MYNVHYVCPIQSSLAKLGKICLSRDAHSTLLLAEEGAGLNSYFLPKRERIFPVYL